MKIVSWNVNGIRSIFKSTFKEWLSVNNPDIICIQEIKTDAEGLEEEFTQLEGYYAYFNSGNRKGHAGVAVYTKAKPLKVEEKIGIERFDDEGRCLKLMFKDFVLFNFYIPHGGRDKENVAFKLSVYESLSKILKPNQPIILAGDFNIAHTELDLCHPKQNENNTMFTPEERRQLDTLISLGYTDTFRYKYPETKGYSQWNYGFNLRENNIGWRIDYFFVTKEFVPLIQDVCMQREIVGSDHCPVVLTLNKELEKTESPVHIKATLFG